VYDRLPAVVVLPIVVVPSSTRRLALQSNEILQRLTGLIKKLIVQHSGLFAHRSDVMLATQKSTKKKNWQTIDGSTKALYDEDSSIIFLSS
jgi:hypothetical protein